MSVNITGLTTPQLQRIITIKQHIEGLQSELGSVGEGNGRGPGRPKGKRKMSAAGRAAIIKSHYFMVAMSLCALAGRLHAATFTVTTTNSSGAGSLAVAIAEADATPGTNQIEFSVTNTITLSLPLPTITNNVAITGNATVPTVISGGGTLPLFTFVAGTTNSLANLVLANGFTMSSGAAINNSGTLFVSSCVMSNNSAPENMGGGPSSTVGSSQFHHAPFPAIKAAVVVAAVFTTPALSS
jgi:hypothetical protein